MKKLVNLFLVVVAFAMFACGGGSNPEAVAEKFLVAIEDGNYDEAKKHCTESTGQIIDQLASMTAMQGDSAKKEPKKIEIVSSEISGDTSAVVKYKADGEEKSIDLVKVEDEWKVDMKKEEMQK